MPQPRRAASMAATSIFCIVIIAAKARGLLTVEPDPEDRRSRRLRITPAGVALMRQAVEVWRAEHAALEAALPPGTAAALRQGLATIRR